MKPTNPPQESPQPSQPSPATGEGVSGEVLPPDLESLAAAAERLGTGPRADAAPGGGDAPRAERQAPKGPPLDEMLAKLLLVTFKFAAPNWNVQLPECALLGAAYADVLNKYYPDGITVGPELGAIFATVVVFGPRLDVPPKPAPKEPPAAEPAPGA